MYFFGIFAFYSLLSRISERYLDMRCVDGGVNVILSFRSIYGALTASKSRVCEPSKSGFSIETDTIRCVIRVFSLIQRIALPKSVIAPKLHFNRNIMTLPEYFCASQEIISVETSVKVCP